MPTHSYMTTSRASNSTGEDLLRWAREMCELDPDIAVEEVASASCDGVGWSTFKVAAEHAQALVDAFTYHLSEQPIPIAELDFSQHDVAVHRRLDDAEGFLNDRSTARFLGLR